MSESNLALFFAYVVVQGGDNDNYEELLLKVLMLEYFLNINDFFILIIYSPNYYQSFK